MATYRQTSSAGFEASKGPAALPAVSLTETMAAVSGILDAIPDNIVSMPSSLAEAFLAIDPVLTILNRQLMDARRHHDRVAAMAGAGGAMTEALNLQICALEQAYGARMAALLRRRREGRDALSHTRADADKAERKDFKELEATAQTDVRRPGEKPHDEKDSLWLWLVLAYMISQTSMHRKSGHRLEAA